MLVNQAQLDFIKAKVAAGASPGRRAFDKAKGEPLRPLAYAPTPLAARSICGAYSNPNIGCGEELRDAIAAYTHALLWYFTGDGPTPRRRSRS